MYKKIVVALVSFVFLGLGAAQLSAYPILTGDRLCCPVAYNGGAFSLAIDYGSYVHCIYSGSSEPYFFDFYCQPS